MNSSQEHESCPTTEGGENRYESIKFVALYWEGPGIDAKLDEIVRSEIDDLIKLLRGELFNYETFRHPLTLQQDQDQASFQRHVEEKILDEHVKTARGSDLMILYYAGHGLRRGELSGYKLKMNEAGKRYPFLDGVKLLNLVSEKSRGSLLVISDTCYAGSSHSRSSKGFGSAELLAAAPSTNTTPQAENEKYWNFTKKLIATMERLGRRGLPFTTLTLKEELLISSGEAATTGAEKNLRETPQLHLLSDPVHHEPIWLHKMEPPDPLAGLRPPGESFPLSILDIPKNSPVVRLQQLLWKAEPECSDGDSAMLLRICQLEHHLRLRTSRLASFCHSRCAAHSETQELDAASVREQLRGYAENLDYRVAKSIVPQQFDSPKLAEARLAEARLAEARQDTANDAIGFTSTLELASLVHMSTNKGGRASMKALQKQYEIKLDTSCYSPAGISRSPLAIQHLPARWKNTADHPRTIEFVDQQRDHAWELLVDVRVTQRNTYGKELAPLLPRVQRLCKQLSLLPSAAACVFDCTGYVHWRQSDLYGLVYTPPAGSSGSGGGSHDDWFETYYLRDLLELRAVETVKMNPPNQRAHRIGLALALARSVGCFHTVDWLHKGLRSRNVLFLARCRGQGSSVTREVDWRDPKIVGLGYGRFVDEVSSKRQQWDQEINAYLYWKRWGEPEREYGKRDDYYSLGVMMLEIALWQPVSELAPFSGMSGEGVKEELLSIARRKLDRGKNGMGPEYRDAVVSCLTAFDNEEGKEGRNDTLASAAAVGEPELRMAFKRLVIDRLAPEQAIELKLSDLDGQS